MKVAITPAMFDLLESLISDGLEPVYRKIGAACTYEGKNLIVEIDDDDAAELISKCENEVGPDGGCRESMLMAWDASERATWLGRERSFQALLKRLKSN